MSTTSRSVIVRLRAEMAQFKKEWNEGTAAVKGTREALGDAEKQTQKTTKATAESGTVVGKVAGNLRNHRKEWDQVGTSVLRTGAVVTGVAALMAKAAVDWETAWTGVTKTVDGTPEQLAQVEEQLRSLARTMPASHKEIAAVAEAAGQLGVERENVAAFTRTMLQLGDTTNLSAEEAATSIQQLMNVMQTAPEDVDRLGAAVVALGNNGASTERDIVQMAQRIAGAGEVVGLTEANVLSLASAVSSSGVEVEAGGTAISKILIDIAKAVDTGSDDLTGFAKVAGVSADDFARKWEADPAVALADFTEGLGRMASSGEDVFTVLDDLGQSDVRTTRALLNMANASDLLRSSLDTGNRAWEENTALVAEAEKRYDTAAAQASIAWNNIKDNAIDAGQAALPAISAISDAVVQVSQAFGALPDPVKAGLGAIAGVAGVSLLVVGGLMKAIGAAADFRSSLTKLETTSPRAGRALSLLAKGFAAVTAAAVAGQVLERWDEIDVSGVNEYTKALLQAADGSDTLLNSLTTADATGLFGWNRNSIDGIADAFDKAAEAKGSLDLSFAHESDWERASKYVEQFDAALTAAVQSGNLESAADMMDVLTEKTGRTAKELVDGFLPGYKDALAGVDNQQSQAAGSAQDLADGNAVLSERLAQLSPDADEAASMLAELEQATSDAALSFVDFSENLDTSKDSFDSWLKNLEDQQKAMDSWADNLIKASQRGVSEGVIKEFEKLGPEGAQRLAELVDASDDEIDRLNSVLGDAGSTAAGLAEILNALPPEAITEFRAPGADDAIAKATELAVKYNLQPDQVQTILSSLDYASADIDKVLSGLGYIDGETVTAKVAADTSQAQSSIDSIIRSLNNINPFKQIVINTKHTTSGDDAGNTARAPKNAGGAITGVGGPTEDNIPIAASVGEHMWTAAEVQAAGGQGAMYAMRAAVRSGRRPSFAVGGAVDDAWDRSYRASAAAYAVPMSVPALPAAASVGPMSATADLRGAEIGVGKDGLMKFVGGYVDIAISQNNARQERRR